MRNGKRIGWTMAAFATVVCAGLGVAAAQHAPPVFAQAPQPAQLSLREQSIQADGFLARMEGATANIRRELEAARASRDVVKSLCLSDKLNQMDVAIRSARDRRSALEQASVRQDTELASHEFTILDVLRQRVEQLTREASQCIGVDAYYIGESRVMVTVDPGIPEPDTSVLPDGYLVSAPPICASCVR